MEAGYEFQTMWYDQDSRNPEENKGAVSSGYPSSVMENTAMSMVPGNQNTEGWLPWNPPMAFNPPPIIKEDYVDLILLSLGVLRKISSTGDVIGEQIQARMESLEDIMVFDINSGEEDPLLCPQIVDDLMRNLKSVEEESRPQTDYMESVQTNIDVNPRERMVCVDWLISVAEYLSLGSDTLHLGVHYFDQYMSGNAVDLLSMQILGLTCLMIATKFQEVKDNFQFDMFVDLAQGAFSRQDIIKMEKSVLVYLDYNLANPTAWSFLDRFVSAAKAGKKNPHENLGDMASYLAELSLLSYTLLQFRPSLVAASCVFLALYYLCPFKMPWNATLQYYTLYKACDLYDCVVVLHAFCHVVQINIMTNVRIKYCQQKYGWVGTKVFPAYVPYELFQD